jgi:hypothetical protein
MALLSFKQVLGPVKLSLMSGAVPILVGERGIGKTSIARHIAKEMGWKFAHIDGNLLKEGEIGGLPTVIGQDGGNELASSEDFKKFVNTLFGKLKTENKALAKYVKEFYDKTKGGEATQQGLRTVYAIHHVLDKVDRWATEDGETPILLFIDEINRCEHAVQQELMNLILNREINGFKLPEKVYLMAAANPSNKFSEFKNTTYQTVDMDEAQEDRMRWFFIGSDEKVWLDWASTVIDEESGETIIHPDIAEFIASNPDALNQPQSQDDIKPSPRSWERLSDSYKVYLANKKMFTKNDLYTIARGDMGPTVALQFTQFLNENANPMVKPEEIFEAKFEELPDDLRARIKAESLPRMLMTVKNAMRYMIRNKKTAKNMKLYVELVTLLPKDLMVMVMMNTLNEHRDFHNKLVALDEYLDAFHNVDQLVD